MSAAPVPAAPGRHTTTGRQIHGERSPIPSGEGVWAVDEERDVGTKAQTDGPARRCARKPSCQRWFNPSTVAASELPRPARPHRQPLLERNRDAVPRTALRLQQSGSAHRQVRFGGTPGIGVQTPPRHRRAARNAGHRHDPRSGTRSAAGGSHPHDDRRHAGKD